VAAARKLRDEASLGLVNGEHPAVSPLVAALTCRCPRCGKGKVLQGLLAVAPRCAGCGLDLHAEDVGDGPAALVILILGAIIVFAAALVELKAAPPLWVHLVLWPPLALIGTILLQRSLKAWLIAMQYRHHLLDAEQPR
jgi:uncharacterized protein (DUF983 family)